MNYSTVPMTTVVKLVGLLEDKPSKYTTGRMPECHAWFCPGRYPSKQKGSSQASLSAWFLEPEGLGFTAGTAV